MSVTATLVRDITCKRDDLNHKLWRLSGDGAPCEYVITSAADLMFGGPETYIFQSDADGTITDWLELEGSFKGDLDHERAIREAGWEIAAQS